MIRTIDNFLPEEMFARLRDFADSANYKNEYNPADGAYYPGISKNIPDDIQYHIWEELAWAHAVNKVKPNYTFMRLSVEGTPTHERYHTDVAMGEYTLVLYLNRTEHCQGGTDVVAHCSGFAFTPRDAEDYVLYKEDQDNDAAWDIVHRCKMKSNRAFIVNSDRLHVAQPKGGFGKDTTDGRLVLCCFYEVQ